MKKSKLEQIVRDRFKTINSLSKKIIIDFDADTIHAFRVAVKKLKALLRLMNTDGEMKKPLIPDLLKTFYERIGNIRNLQLQLQYFKEHSTDQINLRTYLDIIEEEKRRCQTDLKEFMNGKNFKDDEKEILKNIPADIGDAKTKKFTDKKVRKLREKLKDIRGDEEVHSIRKILKDILYNLRYTGNQKYVPGAISDKKRLNVLTSLLGDFEDQCIRIDMIKPEYIASIKSQEELSATRLIKQKFKSEKEILREEISGKLNKLEEQW